MKTPAALPRGVRADAETADHIYLFKAVPRLRATRQIRLLALKAVLAGKALVLCVPPMCRWDPDLEALAIALAGNLRREDLP